MMAFAFLIFNEVIETLPKNFVHPTFSRMFFWGFYPKTNVKDIKVKVKIN